MTSSLHTCTTSSLPGERLDGKVKIFETSRDGIGAAMVNVIVY